MRKTDLLVLETKDSEILFTLGYLHGQDFFNCYLQYVSFEEGKDKGPKKIINGKDYFKITDLLNYFSAEAYFKRVSETKSYKYLDNDSLLGKIFRIREEDVKRIIDPRKQIKKVDKGLRPFIDNLANLLDVKFNNLGLIGTFSYENYRDYLDFDIVIYGRDNCIKAANRIKKIIKNEKNQVIKYNRIHHRLFSADGEIIDPHFVLDDDEESILQQYSFTFIGDKRLRKKIIDNLHSCFTPAVYKVEGGYFVSYAIGHRMLLDIGVELDVKVKAFKGIHKKTKENENFYLWRMENGWVDPTKEKFFNHKVYDIPRVKDV